jgi:hypothetical protein
VNYLAIVPVTRRGSNARKQFGDTRRTDTSNKVPSIPCPLCGSGLSSVLDSRPSHSGVRRRRQCQKCSYRFTTYEFVSVDFVLDYQI